MLASTHKCPFLRDIPCCCCCSFDMIGPWGISMCTTSSRSPFRNTIFTLRCLRLHSCLVGTTTTMLIVDHFIVEAKISWWSFPSLYSIPLTTSLALNLLTWPSVVFYILNAHLEFMEVLPCGRSTNFHVLFFGKDLNSTLIALIHPGCCVYFFHGHWVIEINDVNVVFSLILMRVF